jgi:hypothetical protein
MRADEGRPDSGGDDGAEYVGVVSAVVRDAWNADSLLLGVRRSAATSQRHPAVLSTFTMRVPLPILASAGAAAGFASLEDVQMRQTLSAPVADSHAFGVPGGFRHLSVYLVEAMFARKLGVADALVAGQLRGRVSNLGLARDVVADPIGGNNDEHTLMLSYLVEVTDGVSMIPSSTSSYDPIQWVDGRKLAKAVRSHDALILMPDANPWDICLHGLCVRSAAELSGF